MHINEHIELYGNTDIVQKSDLDFNKFAIKIKLASPQVIYRFLKDNNGDYWLIGLEYLGNGDFSAIIPNFIYGITSIINITKASIDDDRFRFNYIQNKEISDIELNYQKSIIGYSAGGKLTIIGPNKQLKGNSRYFLHEVKAQCVEFKSFDLSDININFLIVESEILKIQFNGVNFGQPESLFGLIQLCRKLKEIDISNIDLQLCRNFQWGFYNNFELERVILPKQAIKVNITLSSLFDGCENLKYVNIQDLDFESGVSLEYSFKDCTNLEKLDMRNIKDKFQVLEQIDWCPELKSLILNSNICENKAELLNSLRYQSCSDSLIIEWL